MCLFPRIIQNPRYKKNKKNGGNIPKAKDPRIKGVPIPCGVCIECRRAKAREWQARLTEEIREEGKAQFVTLTFDEEHYTEETDYKKMNEFAANEIRLLIKRIVKKNRKSIRHWFITELGHEGTERLHIHGITWTNWDQKSWEEIWGRGFVYIGEYCNEKTINYITKYITKTDLMHKEFLGRIFCSKGIGRNWTQRFEAKTRKFIPGKTNTLYKTPSGAKIQLPTYWRKKLFTEDECEKLWIEKIDKQKRYVMGNEISTRKGYKEYISALKLAQETNKKLGFPEPDFKWSEEQYMKKRAKMKLT